MAEEFTSTDAAGKNIEAEAPAETLQPAFPIVGLGASAGGVQAFEAFFSTMPADTSPGMAFVLVQHLSRDHKSILSEIVRRYTKMQVFEIADGIMVQPNCAYIIPPNRDIELVNGALHLLEAANSRGIRLPIDHFFRSLASDQHDRAICIVLSGTGSDGTLGVQAVKGAGGMVMVQSPESTEYDGMPRSAMSTGMVDFVLPPEEMPAQLLAYANQTFRQSGLALDADKENRGSEMERLFSLLRAQTGHDFSQYKRNTVMRRVGRRMAVHQIDRLDEYVRYLQLTRGEVEALFRDLLIGVTNFFRDAEIFVQLEKLAIPKIFEGKPPGSLIRVWVPGCSTGEEAYSIAILLREHIEDAKENFKVQVFATDLDRESIDHARAGIYPPSIVADVSPERLAHFFERAHEDEESFRVHKIIRDMLIFSEHDLIKDPPFSKMDLISCRNLLIYLGTELQKKLMPLFHYALNPGGILLLGSSESVGDANNLFSALDRKAKLYQRRIEEFGLRKSNIANFFAHQRLNEGAKADRIIPMNDNKLPLFEIAQRSLLDFYSPVGALVNDRGDILYLLGRTGKYLEPSPGEAAMNIFKMAREGLRSNLTIALHRAVSQGTLTRHSGSHVSANGDFANVDLTVMPVAAAPDGSIPRGLFLVVFEEVTAIPAPAVKTLADDTSTAGDFGATDINEYIFKLKQEIRAKDEHLQTVIEELETSNEELRSAHEEMQSVNEEMQSTNEELETSKEELQSVNEELATVNSELQAKVADLSRSNNDMKNLLGGTGIGTIFVDHMLRILRFTPAIPPIVNLIETDVGRPVDQIRSNLVGYDSLSADINSVLETLIAKELEVKVLSGEWYLLRIRPYRTLDNVIEGAVITFTEITALKKAQAALQDSEALRRLAIVVRDSRDAIVVQDLKGQILAWNPAAVHMYGWSESEALAMNITDLLPKGDVPLTSGASGLEPVRRRRMAKNGSLVEVSVVISELANDEGNVYALTTTERIASA